MINDKTKIYVGIVEEVIKDNENKPTLELRIRVPSIHGAGGNDGLATSQLPIAKPLVMPGMLINTSFIELIQQIHQVYVIFEFGNLRNPVYIGIKDDQSLYSIADNLLSDIPYATAEEKGVIRLDVVDKTAYIYTQD